MPADIPETKPVDPPIVAIPVAALVHVPPGVVLLNEVLSPIHALGIPVIGAGTGFTVMVVVVVQPEPMA